MLLICLMLQSLNNLLCSKHVLDSVAPLIDGLWVHFTLMPTFSYELHDLIMNFQFHLMHQVSNPRPRDANALALLPCDARHLVFPVLVESTSQQQKTAA